MGMIRDLWRRSGAIQHPGRSLSLVATVALLVGVILYLAFRGGRVEPAHAWNSSSCPRVRVLLRAAARSAAPISAPAGVEVQYLSGFAPTNRLPKLPASPATARSGQVVLEGLGEDPVGFLLRPLEGTLRVGSRSYRGELRLVQDDKGRIDYVNELDLESYLRGVVGVEMSPRFPAPALEAQAVVARTFALRQVLRNRERRRPRSWDLTDDASSQVYGGQSAESHRTDRAVSRSRGVALFRDSELVESFYHSSCGGRTSTERAVFSGDESTVDRGVVCRSCQARKGSRWSVEIAQADLERAVRSCGVSGSILEVFSGSVDRGGRWIDIKVRTTAGTFTVPANRFRLALGSRLLRSLMIDSVHDHGDGVSVVGRGFGHGVGLCQKGASDLGSSGKTCQEILRYYYRDSIPRRAYFL